MTPNFKTIALIGLCLGLALSGCGRKGGLDSPSAVASAPAAPTDPAVTTSEEEQPTPSGGGFFLDFLIK